MYRYRSSLLFILLCLFLLCSTAQATNLQITVLDSLDNVTIPHATVYVNGAQYAMTNNNGQVLLVHNGLDNQLIRVSMSGYDDWNSIALKNQSVLIVNLSRKALTLTVRLYDSDTLGPVSGAQINITSENATQSKQTGASGTAVFGVNASMLYSVEITSSSYEPRSGTVAVADEDKQVEFPLLSGNRFSFVVKDRETKVAIPDAEVRLNDVLAGKTDERGVLNTPITRGKTYAVEIKKEGYETLSESRTISESDALYTIEMTKAPLGAFVYVYDENHNPVEAADIYINGSLLGTTNEYGRGTFKNLVFGTYLVEVSKTGFIPSNRTVTISDKSEDYTIVLTYESADLTIAVQDTDKKKIPNASISIDGSFKGITDDSGQYITRVKFNQLYNITASKDGYQPASVQNQVVQGNTTATINILLEKSMDLGFIGIIVVVVIVVLVLFAAARIFGRRPGGRHIIRRNEI